MPEYTPASGDAVASIEIELARHKLIFYGPYDQGEYGIALLPDGDPTSTWSAMTPEQLRAAQGAAATILGEPARPGTDGVVVSVRVGRADASEGWNATSASEIELDALHGELALMGEAAIRHLRGLAPATANPLPEHLLSGETDAAVWAREFMRADAEHGVAADEQTMLGWFANAIESGRSAGQAERETEAVLFVCDKKPGPEGCTFIETEDVQGKGIGVGEWIDLADGRAALEIEVPRRVITRDEGSS